MLTAGKVLSSVGNTVSRVLSSIRTFDIFSLMGKGVLVKFIIPILAGVMFIGGAVMSFKNAIIEAVIQGDYNMSGKGLAAEENRQRDTLYRELAGKSIDLTKPEQYDYILPYKIIAGLDMLLYGEEGTDDDREAIVGYKPGQGIRPEFEYVKKQETYQQIIKVKLPDGTEVLNEQPVQTTTVELLEKVTTYCRKLTFEYKEGVYEYKEQAIETPNEDGTTTVTEVWARKKIYVVDDIKGGKPGEKNYAKLEIFIEENDPDPTLIEEHIKTIKELDEMLEQVSLADDENWGYGGSVVGAEGIQICSSEVCSLPINIPMLLSKPLDPDVMLTPGSTKPQILIYQTHTNEAYSDGGKLPNVSDDPNMNVVKVGEKLAQDLRRYGIEVIHDRTVHCPPLDGAYARSLDTIKKILTDNPSIKLVIDVHRDILKQTAEINGVPTAKVMFCACGDPKDNAHWQDNLQLMIKMQKNLTVQYPGLMRNIYMKNFAMNQHISKGAFLIEFGGDKNSLAEALASTRYIAEAIIRVTAPHAKPLTN